MKHTNYTPGPWFPGRSEREGADTSVYAHDKAGGDPWTICHTVDLLIDGVYVRVANAHLIASAPDLLAACKRLLELCEAGEGADMYGQEQARAAIARAEGRQP